MATPACASNSMADTREAPPTTVRPDTRPRKYAESNVQGFPQPFSFCAAAQRFWDLPLALILFPMDSSPISQGYWQGLRSAAVA
jgi:hypothetical protein